MKKDQSVKKRLDKRQNKSVNFDARSRVNPAEFSAHEQSSHSIHFLNDASEKRYPTPQKQDGDDVYEDDSNYNSFPKRQFNQSHIDHQYALTDEYRKFKNLIPLDPTRSNDSLPPSKVSTQQKFVMNLSARTSSLENIDPKGNFLQNQETHAAKSGQSNLVYSGYRAPLQTKKLTENSSSARSSYEKSISRLQGVEILLSDERFKNTTNAKTMKPFAQSQQYQSPPMKENINIAEKSARLTNRSVILISIQIRLTCIIGQRKISIERINI